MSASLVGSEMCIRDRSHAKMVVADHLAIIGSCSWTTASRANNEIGVLVELNDAGRDRLENMFEERMLSGVPL
eukprot:4863521-Alexandrium_andersonii.AAC.1